MFVDSSYNFPSPGELAGDGRPPVRSSQAHVGGHCRHQHRPPAEEAHHCEDNCLMPPISVGRGGVGLHPPHSVHQPGDGGQVPGLDPGPGEQSAIQQHYTHAHNNKVILEIWNLFILLLTVFICIQSNSSYLSHISRK